MRVRVVEAGFHGDREVNVGDVLDLQPDVAGPLIAAGVVVPLRDNHAGETR